MKQNSRHTEMKLTTDVTMLLRAVESTDDATECEHETEADQLIHDVSQLTLSHQLLSFTVICCCITPRYTAHFFSF